MGEPALDRSQPWDSGRAHPGSVTALGHWEAHPAGLSQCQAQEPPAPPAPGLRWVRSGSTSPSTAGALGSAGLPLGSGGLSLRGNKREEAAELDTEHEEGRWKVIHYPSLPQPIKPSPSPWRGESCPAQGRWDPPKPPPGASRSIRGEWSTGQGLKITLRARPGTQRELLCSSIS